MLKKYIKNITYLINMPKKDKYNKTTKYTIGKINNKPIYLTEFLFAKQRGWIKALQGHDDIEQYYYNIIPYIFYFNLFDGYLKNIKDNRKIYYINDNANRKIFHVVDIDNFLVSVFVVSEKNFHKQLGRRFEYIKNPNGGTATPHILSPARPFWRHLDILEELYQNFKEKSTNPKKVFTIGDYWRDKYGEKVYKIPISITGFTCPNIDGTITKGGCTFCENESFSPNLVDKSKFKLNLNSKENPYLQLQLKQLQEQFTTTKKILEKKFNAKKFIVYFQSFTNTYAPLDTLKALYEKALNFKNVIGLSIGTRTDCITEETLDYLVELKNRNFEIWVEYGIQSIYNETLKAINRGHDFENIKEYIKKTKEKDLLVCGHLIFGLPNETQQMMLNSVKETIKLKVDSIKFHPLYVVKNTLLTNEYKKGKFTPISEELYIDTLIKSIKMLPDNITISRVTAGISDNSLLAPLWCKNKHTQIHHIKQALLTEGLIY